MDSSPKQPDASVVLVELQQALDGAARCIELAKRETARIDASLRAQSPGVLQVEQEFLDNARKGREQLRLLDLRYELPPSPPQALSPARSSVEVLLLGSEEEEAALSLSLVAPAE